MDINGLGDELSICLLLLCCHFAVFGFQNRCGHMKIGRDTPNKSAFATAAVSPRQGRMIGGTWWRTFDAIESKELIYYGLHQIRPGEFTSKKTITPTDARISKPITVVPSAIKMRCRASLPSA